MRVPGQPHLHLTYCQNIHPGETWAEHYAALADKASAVQRALGGIHPFGIGLRIAATAASELLAPETREQGRALFARQHMYPFTINGFPYGQFHRGPVKENVYAPDWRTPERLEYTLQLADLLADWLPEGLEGSISTVPGSFARWISSKEHEHTIARQLGFAAAALHRLEHKTGRRIHLGLEPEPDCFLETTPQTLFFFQETLPAAAVPVLQSELGVGTEAAREILRTHVGVCFDTCHVALQFEHPADSLRAYRDAGILISKIQISAALRAPAHEGALEALRAFREPVYLHQLKARTSSGTIRAWSDLPEALEALEALEAFPSEKNLEEVRVHFHVPLFVRPRAPLASTADTLDAAFWQELKRGVCPHLEIETYTFDVLPPEVHPGNLVESIAQEYHWVLAHLNGG